MSKLDKQRKYASGWSLLLNKSFHNLHLLQESYKYSRMSKYFKLLVLIKIKLSRTNFRKLGLLSSNGVFGSSIYMSVFNHKLVPLYEQSFQFSLFSIERLQVIHLFMGWFKQYVSQWQKEMNPSFLSANLIHCHAFGEWKPKLSPIPLGAGPQKSCVCPAAETVFGDHCCSFFHMIWGVYVAYVSISVSFLGSH